MWGGQRAATPGFEGASLCGVVWGVVGLLAGGGVRVSFYHLMPFGELDTTSQPFLGFCSAEYGIRFPCFPLHVRLPQVSVGRTSGSSPSRVHGSPRRPRLAALELNPAMRGVHEVSPASLRASLLSSLERCARWNRNLVCRVHFV